ncbi:hypothetical protein [Plantactinospora sp. KLBMP9567]|uniref:hypothetical protein n=1 Tax=Plantactinospora sp. KLBMP9567 TaxID=3085900 RepID=UPI00298227B7|nr:hypothetical protein [Plantactinospora sp. KLBMP9567]MDW5324076.1 hypothetical protein [Plantactinospora sp. KLBMP9567]
MPEVTETKLDDWREQLGPMLAGLQDFVVGPDKPLDHSVESLRDLEHTLLAETPVGHPPREGLAVAAGGYLGEALLTIGGGAWTWDPDSDLPVAGLGVGETAEPMRLVLDALVERTGRVWSAEYERIRALAAARRTEDPCWEPRRTDRPALHTETSDAASTDPWLTQWLTVRARAFPEWSAATGRADELDFSPESLLTLEQVVRRRIPNKDALRGPVDDDFVQGAIWYIGEIARRHRDAHWRYHPNRTGTSKNPYAGRPFVQQDRGGNDAIPLLELQAAVLSDEPGVLLDRFEVFD